MSIDIFSPVGTTKSLSAGTTTGSVALPVVTDSSRAVRVHNSGAVPVFVNFGTSAVTAVLTTSIPLGPGATEWLEVGQKVTHAAGITANGSATVYFTEGFGQ